MDFAELEVSFKRLTENQVVQREMLNRLERVVASNTDAIAANSKAIGHLANAMQSMNDNMRTMQDKMLLMQDAMHALFSRMDRFIRGLEGNGHRPQ